MVGADAFAAAVSGEFGGDGEGAGLQFFDGVAVGLDEVEDGGVAAGEVVEGGAPVGAAGADGDADAGDLGVDFEVGFAADGDAGGVGGAVGDGGWCGVRLGRGWSYVPLCHRAVRCRWRASGHQIETCRGLLRCGVVRVRIYARCWPCCHRGVSRAMPLNRRSFWSSPAADRCGRGAGRCGRGSGGAGGGGEGRGGHGQGGREAVLVHGDGDDRPARATSSTGTTSRTRSSTTRRTTTSVWRRSRRW